MSAEDRTENYDFSDWERLSSHPSSSDDDDGDGDSDDWVAIRRTPKLQKQHMDEDDRGQETGDQEDEDEDVTSDCGLYEEGAQETDGEGEDLRSMKEMLATFHPELVDGHNFSLEYTEQCVFPYLPARNLLRLRHASARWARWISSPFFAHAHSLTARSLSGFFFHDTLGFPSFASLGPDSTIPDPSLAFLPEPVFVKASNHGLLCCRGRASQKYYVCNPMTGQWAELPPTIGDHGPETAAVIVMQEPLTFNFDDDYFLVCAYEILDGVYGFETFSSERWGWRKSNEIVAAERVVAGSGAAASGAAYWRTTMQRVVAFDPALDACQEMACPAPEAAEGRRWEIGELGRKLCAVIVGPAGAEVRGWEDGSRWRVVGSIEVDGLPEEEAVVVPLRAQGEREVAAWDGSKMAVTATDLELRTVRRLVGPEVPGHCADFMPYVSSLVHVKRHV